MLAKEKLLFTVRDVCDLLGLKPKDVLKLARHLGLKVEVEMLSAWAVRQLIQGLRTGKIEGVRFDRQAIVWQLLRANEDPLEPPAFQEAWEQEIERVAQLPEPARTLRSQTLWEQMRDAQTLAQAVTQTLAQTLTTSHVLHSPDEQPSPSSPACESCLMKS